MVNHGITVTEKETSTSTPNVAASGVPFVIGAAPAQSAMRSAQKIGMPILCTSWNEAVERLGYSDDWKSYPLCEFMHSHFRLFGMQPVIFCNLLNPATMKKEVAAADIAVNNHKVELPIEAINDTKLIVKPEGGTGADYIKDTDYGTYYNGNALIVEALPDGGCYTAKKLSIAYTAVTPESVTTELVATGLENIEYCMSVVGVAPDLICAPGYSEDATVAAVMATKAAGINGMFKAKALIDISSDSESGADSYDKVLQVKNRNNFTAKEMLDCWTLPKFSGKVYHMSTQLAGLIALVDASNGGCPYESPSNKAFKCDSMVRADGEEVNLTLSQANIVNAAGVVTALNALGDGWTAWGNYTACYPANTDVKDHFIPVSRMFAWIGNTVIRTVWKKLDKPQNRRLIDSIMNSINIWLNGLTGQEYLLGAQVEFRDDENPLSDLAAGIIRFHISNAPPLPTQAVEFILEFNFNYVTAALQG